MESVENPCPNEGCKTKTTKRGRRRRVMIDDVSYRQRKYIKRKACYECQSKA